MEAGDKHIDLVLMWQAVQQGWAPPFVLDENRYNLLKNSDASAERGFAGFACSFAGKWFGGYARAKRGGCKVERYAEESAKNLIKMQPYLGNINLRYADFSWWSLNPDTIVYCDPPYEGTTGYRGTWEPRKFWRWAENAWNAYRSIVLVSEFKAPEGWKSIWSKKRGIGIQPDTRGDEKTENLFILEEVCL